MSHERPNRPKCCFEFTVIGSTVKVTAIDSVTATEVSVMGPASASQADLQQLALAQTEGPAGSRASR